MGNRRGLVPQFLKDIDVIDVAYSATVFIRYRWVTDGAKCHSTRYRWVPHGEVPQFFVRYRWVTDGAKCHSFQKIRWVIDGA